MPSALHAFTALGERLERAWSAAGYDERAFPDLAHAHLADADLGDVRPAALLVEFLRATTLPAQHAIDFGRPALVVHDGRHFFVEVLYWTAGSVSIHQHAFSGAFRVLGGSSVHCSFRFDEVHRVNSRFLLGELTRTGNELLETGATRTIAAGTLIHSLFHLDQPSVTVVVRTRSEAAALPQYTYEPPHVALDSFYRDPIGRRRLETLALLREIQAPEWRAAFTEHVTGGDLQMCYDGLRLVLDDPALFADLFAQARRSHGERADYLPPVFERMQRRDVLVARRKTITDAGHRFFLALLLNLDTREQILAQVAARFPGPPIATVLRWVRELSTRCGADDPVFGLHLSDAESEIFECLLHGRSFPEVLRQLVDSYGADEVESQQVDIAQFHGALRDNQVYKPLFQA